MATPFPVADSAIREVLPKRGMLVRPGHVLMVSK